MDKTLDRKTRLFRIENNAMTLCIGEAQIAHIDTRHVEQVGVKFLSVNTSDMKSHLNETYVMRGP